MSLETELCLFRDCIYILHNPSDVNDGMAEWSKALVVDTSFVCPVGSKPHVGNIFLRFLLTLDTLLAIVCIKFHIALY